MLSLAKFSIRRPKTALAGWVVVIAALTVLGLSVDQWMSPTVTASGTQAYKAKQLSEEKFGQTQQMPLLLEGPKAQLDQQGPKLAAALIKRGNTQVISPWAASSASASLGLRPKANEAMMLVFVPRSQKDVIKTDLPQIQKIISQQVSTPVKAYLSGEPVINQAVAHESVTTLETYAAIATGVLFVLLLIGLRAPLGALLVTIVGSATTMATLGLMTLLGRAGFEIDSLCLATAAIAGLARGASYSLVMLDRFHHEKEAHPDRPDESHLDAAVGTTGRAILYGGTAMLAALLVVEVFGVTNVVETIGIAALLATLLATGAAVVVVPAGLALFGHAVAWHLPAPAFLSGAWNRMVAAGGSIVRHPLPFGALATAVLLVLAVPAFGVEWSAQSLTKGLLPADNQARVAAEQITRVMGAGYLSPYQITVYDSKGPITSAATLTKLNSFEKQIVHDKAVVKVVGPGGTFNANASQLQKVGPGLQNSIKVSKESATGLTQLIAGLGQAGAGSAEMQQKLGQAASGAGDLHSFLGQAMAGSQQVAAGLNLALAGANQLSDGANQALAGANQLSAGLGAGAPKVKAGLPAVQQMANATASTNNQIRKAQSATQSAQSDIAGALESLNAMGVGKTDPKYQSTLSAVQAANSSVQAANTSLAGAGQTAGTAALLAAGVNSQINELAPQLAQAATGSAALAAGIQKLRDGNAKLAKNMVLLANGGGQISSGLTQLTNGAAQLAAGLAAGVPQVGQLTAGLGTMRSAVVQSKAKLPSTKDLEALFKSSPGLFSSGYFVLAAVAGAPPADRIAANSVINLTRGGNAGQIVVWSRYPLDDSQLKALGERLKTMSASFAKTSGLETLVGGTAGDQWDTAQVTMDKLPAVLIALGVGIGLLLMLLLRAILIPAAATLIAVLTTAAGFGVIQLLFGGSNPPLGGTGKINPVVITEIVSALYGATLIYIVLLMSRARDFYVVSGDARGSLRHGMRATIAATTGMATITIGVLIPFAFTGLVPIRMVAVAAVLAVAMIAYVVLPVLLPAAMSLLGRAGWWPTRGPQLVQPAAAEAPAAAERAARPARRLPRPHLPHRGTHPAH